MIFKFPLVSVIIPAYNHEKYVQATINSIINQTYKNIELIIIDDGSKDNTWSKILEMKEKCEKRFKKVIFQTKENEGTCETLNKLVSLTRGKFVYLIASDDIAKPYAIEKEVEFLSKNKDYALVVGNNEFIDSAGNRCFWDKEKNIVYEKKDAIYKTFSAQLQEAIGFNFNEKSFGSYETLCIGNYIPNGYLIKNNIFKKIGKFTEEAPLEDYYMMLQISKFAKMKYLDEILLCYRWHQDNSIKNKEKIIAFDRITRAYEEKICKDIKALKSKKAMQDVLNFIQYGHLCYSKNIIPFILKIDIYNCENKKIKIVKIFGKQIFILKKQAKSSIKKKFL